MTDGVFIRSTRGWWQLVVVLICGGIGLAAARDQQPAGENGTESPHCVVATVDAEPIYAAEVKQFMEGVPQPDSPSNTELCTMHQNILTQLINRRLILRYLARTGQAAGDDEVTLAMEQLENRLASRGQTLSDYLQKHRISRDILRRQVAWNIGWRRYADQYLTDKNLQTYFFRHRRDFDGTRVHVAHILVKLDSAADRQPRGQVVQQLLQVRKAIVAGELSFADAAKKYSQAPSGASGGDIGWISRHEPMPESFSRVAFALNPGEVSMPVTTTFGVHLILCQEIKPGPRRWEAVRAELARAVEHYLFQWVADRERPQAEIQRGNLQRENK